ncbi:MAG: hypothetical protein KC656_06515 [Myxococcales bacterium]|nr:hypothetical protein [Myxococcales bacterium]
MAIARLHPECGIPPRVADVLASRVPVDGWGTLKGWLAAPEDHRPALPFEVRGLLGRVLDPSAHLESESSGSRVLDAFRLVLGRVAFASRHTLFVNPDGWFTAVWESQTVCVSFGGRSRVVRAAEEGDSRALGLVLLDAVRRLHAFESASGAGALDLLALQRAALDAVRAVGRG